MITANLDQPFAGAVIGTRLIVAGWAISDGPDVVRVECYIDGVFRGALRPRFERPDLVAAGIADAGGQCGFAGAIDVADLSSGGHLLRILIYDAAYQALSIEAAFRRSELATRMAVEHRNEQPPKIIAFYLPQYHPIPENNAWWGRGFTEWTNVARAKPLYRGHYQPHVPADLGFYDLRLPEARVAQAALARKHGIYGFAYYHYWFNGKRLLERPFNEVLSTKAPQFPFCVCYANENWTRRWDGLDSEVLMGQEHSVEDDRAFIRDLLPAFQDERYIRIENRPLLLVYRPSLMPDPVRTATIYREECARAGEADPYLVYAQSFGTGDPAAVGFDAAIEFPPLGFGSPGINVPLEDVSPHFRGSFHDYEDLIEIARERATPPFTLFRGVAPSWDNTARKAGRSHSFVNAAPEGYRRWLNQALAWTVDHHRPSRRFVFVNAWNEWGEGCHLEPDIKYGRLYLEATLEEVRRFGEAPAVRVAPKVSVVIPSYNHERFIERALASVLGQTLSDLEVIMVDDGSTDGTIAAAQAFLRSRSFAQRVTIRAQANAGAHVALARGISEATGTYIAVLNSDDAYEPARLETLVRQLEERNADLAFSRVRYYDDAEQDLTHTDGYAKVLFDKQLESETYPDLAYALLDFNVSISTGNFVFRRELFDRVGGFVPLVLTHDWHFVLSAWRLGKVIYVPEDLYRYRLHGTNSFRGYGAFGSMEGRIVMRDFFSDPNAVSRLKRLGQGYYSAFIDSRALQEYASLCDADLAVR
jgi:glycosyltransferase involved in cell wall biosynthesis